MVINVIVCNIFDRSAVMDILQVYTVELLVIKQPLLMNPPS